MSWPPVDATPPFYSGPHRQTGACADHDDHRYNAVSADREITLGRRVLRFLVAGCVGLGGTACVSSDASDIISLDSDAGAPPPRGGEMGAGGTPSGAGGAIPMGAGGAGVPDLSCVDAEMESSVPVTADSQGAARGDDVGPAPCVPSTRGSVDFVALFRAPYAGEYVASTAGSRFDTVLHVRAGGCEGRTLACNDDHMAMASQVTVRLEADEEVLFVVDGFNAMTGQVQLSISGKESDCGDDEDNDGDGDADCEDIDCFLVCEDPADWPADWADKEDEMLVYVNEARARGARGVLGSHPGAGQGARRRPQSRC